MRKRKILRFFGIALCVILGVLVFWQSRVRWLMRLDWWITR